MFSSPRFRRYFLPGFVFQSVLIGGGYGTGRELVEFFLSTGPLTGLLGMLVSTLIWSLVCGVTYELARAARNYDYRSFTKALLGRVWVLYEVYYSFALILTLAVLGAAAGSILTETFRLPYFLGVVIVMAAVALLVFKGSTTIEKYLSLWSFVLYGIYVILFVWTFFLFGPELRTTLSTADLEPGWFLAGLRYACYNIAVTPALLFSVRHIETRREAFTAGALAGPIGIIPGVLFCFAMIAHYPAVLDQTVPANFVVGALGSDVFRYVFQIGLVGTFIETGGGLIHSLNERLAGSYAEQGRDMPQKLRPVVGIVMLLVAAATAQLGLVELIAKGYGTLTWLALGVYVIPVVTLGLWKVGKSMRSS